MPRLSLCLLASAMLCGQLGSAQQTQSPRKYMLAGVVQHHGTTATVIANLGRPLQEAVTSVREEYGWVVDYEDPPYQSKYDLVDETPPGWRTAHPGAVGFLIPSGGRFESTYQEDAGVWHSSDEEGAVLSKIVSDYNQTQNPGRFIVRAQPDGSFAVIGDAVTDDSGNEKPVSPILDAPVSIPGGSRNAYLTLKLVASALSIKTGTVVQTNGAANLLAQTQITLGGPAVPARSLLLDVIAATGRKLVWNLLYDPRFRMFVLNLGPAVRIEYDTFGQKRVFYVGPFPPPNH